MTPKIHIPDYIFELPEHQQNLWFKDWLIEVELIYSAIHYANLDVSIYFPFSNVELLKKYSKEEIRIMDKLYLKLAKRKFILLVEWKSLPKVFADMNYMHNAVFAIFADDYQKIYQQDKDNMIFVNPTNFVKSVLN